jgi:hypothetical protein
LKGEEEFLNLPLKGEEALFPLPFKGRVRVGMGYINI